MNHNEDGGESSSKSPLLSKAEEGVKKLSAVGAKNAISFFQDFKQFLARGNVIDLAVALVVGGAFGVIVTSFVDDLVFYISNCLDNPTFRISYWTSQHGESISCS
jgi:hypothetical protein